MIRKSFAGMVAALCVLSNASALPTATVSAEGAATTKVTVDLSAAKTAISPYIYGVNAFDSSSLKNLTTHNIRQGGNRFTGYNWETNWSNAGEDWHNSSDTNQGDSADGPAGAVRKFSDIAKKNNVEYKLATLQMAGYVAADKDGEVKAGETAPSKRWNEVVFKKDGALADTPDLTDDKVYMDEYVNYLVKNLGDAESETGIQGYSLDNEPVLWNDTHPYLHPEEVSSTELISKSIELAKVVKDIDPKAEVFGPAFWGMLPCMNCGDGSDIKDKTTGAKIGTYDDKDWQAVKANYSWFLDYYLESMAKAEKDNGKRLLDVIDVHYYSQGLNTDDDILQAARSLYDPEYEENSWLMPWGKSYFPFVTRIKESVDKYYPGTKIAISEYNLGNISNEKTTGKDIRTGLAEAEALGAFAMNNVYFATYWGTMTECPYVQSAINLYTNYDGKGSAFGNNLVKTSVEDLSKEYAYAAINDSDDKNVTMVIGNKENTAKTNVIDISGTDTKYKSAVVYAVTQEDSGIRVINVNNDIKDNKIEVELPAMSIATVVLSDKASDAKVYEAPDIEEKKVEYKFDELELSVNKAPMIPIEDKEHLKRIIINCTASSSTGSSWYCGGGGLCFNQVVKSDGTLAGWGSKSFSYSGSGDCIVEMDGTFTIPDPAKDGASIELENADYKDTYIEFQDWWKSSANSESGADVSVTYNTITMVYEYDHTGEVKETTTTASTTATSTATTTTTASSTGEVKATLIGDANLDNSVTVADAVTILQFIGNKDKYNFNDEAKANADCFNPGDGITGKDALAIQKLDAKIIKSLPEIEK
ncbi:MAG: glycoside hydrolase [Ruminococcus sp.]|nr:glycoside hydrolase [Ruminococcus sp.]